MTKRQKREKMAFLATLVVWVAVAALVALFWSTTARAQAVCTERSKIVASLGKTYQEAPVSVGLTTGGGAVIEVFAAEDGSTFTLIITRPNGISCIMAAGEAWVNIPFVLKKKKGEYDDTAL